VNVIGHSNCPRQLSAPGYTFHTFTKGGATLNDIYQYPLNQCYKWYGKPSDMSLQNSLETLFPVILGVRHPTWVVE
ncbi:MAG: hypothetical protein AAGK05_18815, partial [Pseudomonadota bacterium]